MSAPLDDVAARWALERWDAWATGILGKAGDIRDHGRANLRGEISARLLTSAPAPPEPPHDYREQLQLAARAALDKLTGPERVAVIRHYPGSALKAKRPEWCDACEVPGYRCACPVVTS